MCVPACQKRMTEVFSRRNFLKAVSAGGAVATASLMSAPVMADEKLFNPLNVCINKVVDLTHTLSSEFPTFVGVPQLEVKSVTTLAKNGYSIQGYNIINEHMGTHLDAPNHFSDGATADVIPAADLVGPLCIVDLREKANANPDALVEADDLTRWERRYGRIPFGAIVAMNSGWDANASTPKFRNADNTGVMHFPGFSIDAVNFLLDNRMVKGIMVDTLSLDYGPSTKFDVHFAWLPAGRWGVESMANLGALPARGATVVAAVARIKGATGGFTRVLAFI